jgi:NitT/TauT family transport system substrate-binding protein
MKSGWTQPYAQAYGDDLSEIGPRLRQTAPGGGTTMKIISSMQAAILCCALMAGVLTTSGASRAQTALQPVKVMSSLANLTVAVPYAVVAEKFDKAHGLDIEMLSVGGASNLMVDAVISGSTLFSTPGTATALQAIRAGAKLRIIAAVANNQMVAVMRDETLKKLNVSPSSPIADRIRALKGLTIGTNPPGSTMNQLLRAYLKQYGMDGDKDVSIIGTADASALITGLVQGRYDVIVAGSGQVEQAISLKSGTLWFSGARGDIPGSEKSMIDVIVASEDTIQKNPALVDAYIAALQDALNVMRRDHEGVGRLMRAQYFQKLDPDVWNLVWSAATAGYPTTTTFSKDAYDFWIGIDAKGPESYKDLDFNKIIYVPANQR